MSDETAQSRCYAIQLQIDSFLDGDLVGVPAQSFLDHIGSCADCAKELRFAQHLHERVLDLPMLDCDDAVIDRLISTVRSQPQQSGEVARPSLKAEGSGVFAALKAALAARNGGGLALGSALLLVVAVGVIQFAAPNDEQQLAESRLPVDPQSELDSVRVALEDLNLAIDTLNRLSRRTESLVSERFVLQPLREGVLGTVREAIYEPQNQEVRGPI